jgi:transcriptional regulator of nitric oxide reductase
MPRKAHAHNVESVSGIVRSIAATCTAPTVVTLITDGTTISGRPETALREVLTADTAAATLADMALLIARHPSAFDAPTVFGYALILPGERVAFAADRTEVTHHIQLPGIPTETLRVDRWSAICDGLTTMIKSATR